jgi:hypothetical protein
MDEISHEPRGNFRLPPVPPGRWRIALAACAIGVTCVVTVLAVVLPNHAGGPRAARVTVPTPGSAPAPASSGGPGVAVGPPPPGSSPGPAGAPGAPGTVLLSCGSATWGQLDPDWREWSVHVGPLWFADSQQSGYVRYGRPASTGRVRPAGSVASTIAVMIVEVAAGSRVVLKPAAGAGAYFHFVTGFGPGTAYPLPPGATGFTFAPCPASVSGPNGELTDYLIGFSIELGRMAPVEVWTSPSARPVWLTFTAPV